MPVGRARDRRERRGLRRRAAESRVEAAQQTTARELRAHLVVRRGRTDVAGQAAVREEGVDAVDQRCGDQGILERMAVAQKPGLEPRGVRRQPQDLGEQPREFLAPRHAGALEHPAFDRRLQVDAIGEEPAHHTGLQQRRLQHDAIEVEHEGGRGNGCRRHGPIVFACAASR